jgi:ABC-2 type transport system permease protein
VTVARRWLRDRRRGLLWWCAGITALVAFTVAFFPSVEGDETFEELADELPAGLSSLLGVSEGAPLTSAPGYLHARLFSTLVPLLLVVYAIGLGARAIGGTEEDGTLELLLSQPVTRTRVAVERYGANLALLGLLAVTLAVAVAALAAPVGALDGVSLTGLAGASFGAFALALLHGTIAFTAGAATGRRAPAVGIATAVGAAGYLVEGLLALGDAADPLRFVSPWHWYLGRNMLVDGVALDAVVAPLLASAMLVALATRLFERRDLR